MSDDAAAPARLFLLVGPPAVGKLSLARELERRVGAIVVDNHLVSNPVFIPMGLNSGEDVDFSATDDLRRRVWDIVLEAAAAAPRSLSHVMTSWLTDDESAEVHVQRLRSLAHTRGATFVPVWLRAGEETLLARVDAPGRAERGKLTDASLLQQILAVPTLPAPEDAIELDLSHLTPEQAAEQVLAASS